MLGRLKEACMQFTYLTIDIVSKILERKAKQTTQFCTTKNQQGKKKDRHDNISVDTLTSQERINAWLLTEKVLSL